MLNLSFSLTELEYFLLIVARTAGFVASAPFFSNTATPRTVKVGFTVLLSVLLYNVLPVSAVEYSTVFMYAVIVVKESLTGLLIGYGANICSSILNFAGHMVDMETGLSMVTLYDPMTRENTTITGSFYQYTITLMLFISGLYQYILMALKESFSLIPINGAIFKSDALLASMLEFLTDYISIGFTICLPIFCCILLLNCILGILAKVSPNMNMFAVGIQFKILCGLTVMLITVGMLPDVSRMILSETQKVVTMFIGGMT